MKRSPVLIVFITIMIDMIGFGIIIPILPNYGKSIGGSSLEVGIITAVYSLMNFLFSAFWGTLSDRYGRRPIMLISIALTAVSYFIFSFSNTLLLLFVSRMLAGIGSANISTVQACIADVSTPENRAKMMGVIGASFGLGFIIGPVVGGLVSQHPDKIEYFLSHVLSISYFGQEHFSGMEYVGFTAASFSFINVLMAFFLFPETNKLKNPEARFEFHPFRGLQLAFKKEVIRDLFLINFLYITAFAAMQLTAAILWKEHYSLTQSKINYVFAFIGVASATVQLGLVGWLNKNFGERKLITSGALMMLLALALFPVAPVNWFVPTVAIIIVLISVANGCITPALTALISKNSPDDEQGQILGLNMSFASLARVAGPLIGGMVYDWHYSLPYILGASIMGVAWFFATRVLQLKDSQTMPKAL